MVLEIKLKDNSVLLIDACDFVNIYNSGYKIESYENRYAVARKGKLKREYVHRLVTSAKKNEIVDHVNGNTFDCRKVNLRITDSLGNNRNRRALSHKRFKGVYEYKNRTLKNKYYAQLSIDRKRKHIGCFNTEEEAAMAYDKRAFELFGEMAKLNFPFNKYGEK